MSLHSELEALVYLLEDPDDGVFEQVKLRIIELGQPALSYLEDILYKLENPLQIERTHSIIKYLKFDTIITAFREWRDSGAVDLLEGVILLSKIKYPEVEKQDIDNAIDKIKLDAWLELHDDLTSYEKVRILNHIFYQVHGFKGDSEDYHHADNSYINKVLERHRGNPISLAIVYSIVAQRLNIPIFGVNLPQHFVLGYKAGDDPEIIRAYNLHGNTEPPNQGEVLFYINPFSQGLVLSHQSIREFLAQIKVEPKKEYFEFCSHLEILQRMVRNLLYTYDKEKNDFMIRILSEIMEILNDSESPT